MEQPGGIFKDIDPVAFQQKQKELKEKILADIEERRAKIESEKMAQQEAEQAALQAPPEEPEDPVGPGLDKAAPFNAFGGTALANKVKEELADSDEEENENLVLQDLRWCISCKSKSYVRQGLCINLYRKLYYMSRADSGTRLCARGKISEGRKWSAQEWVSSGSFSQVEESLLKENFCEALLEVALYVPPPMKSPNPAAIPAGETIAIEDLESGEIMQPAPVENAAWFRWP